MQNQIIENKAIGEKYVKARHESGLDIYVCEKRDYASSYALFGTRYGSIDVCFKTGEDADFVHVPAGIAHFLEHKLFESEDGDAFTRYAKTGAYANAYTSFDRTCYLFSCSDQFEENLGILMDFVQSPYFTKETVEKEQGIIGQEIRMYDDSPTWRVLFNLLGCLYHEHSVKVDIAGTVESIAKIDKDLLYRCYHTFYNPANMFLCVAGNVEAARVLELCDKWLKPVKPVEISRTFPKEPRGVAQSRCEQKLAVAMPLFTIGYKEACESAYPSVKRRVVTELALEALFGNFSPFYKEMFDAGLINDQFGSEYFFGNGYAACIFEGESRDPDRVYEAMNRELERARKNGIDEGLLEAARRKLYGRQIMKFNTVESTAGLLVNAAFLREDPFAGLEAYRHVTAADVMDHLRSALRPEDSALSMVLPNG